jgi:hypothetical protein
LLGGISFDSGAAEGVGLELLIGHKIRLQSGPAQVFLGREEGGGEDRFRLNTAKGVLEVQAGQVTK